MRKIVATVLGLCLLTTIAQAQETTVRRGDTLTKIALRELGNASRWSELCGLNKDVLRDCDVLPVGATLQLTAPAPSSSEKNVSEAIDTPINELSKIQAVILKCGPLDASPGVERTYEITMNGTTIALSRGTPGSDPYESWNGSVDLEGVVSITGEYIEGSPELKKIAFTGKRTPDGRFEASGNRGPRECTVRSS